MKTTGNNNNIQKKKYPQLQRTIETDVAVVGGGLAGVMSAYLLAKAGKRVVLLESKEIGSGATLLTTAFITQVIDTNISDLADMFGRKVTKLVWESGRKAIEELEAIARAERIDCEFNLCPAYQFANTKKQLAKLESDAMAARRMEFDVSFHRENQLEIKHAGYLKINHQAKFHPAKFLFALAEKAVAHGASLFENSRVTDIAGDGPVTVYTKEGKIVADDVIVATHWPFDNPRKTWFKKGIYVSYVLEFEMPPRILPEAIYWDLDNPYHYFRVDSRGECDRLILGGGDHRKEIPVDIHKIDESLEKFLRKILGSGVVLKMTKKWAGPILEPSDGLPLIGRVNPHYYVASAFSGNGMTYSAIAAMMFRDMILGIKNPWERVYDPIRIPTLKQIYMKGRDYIGEFFGGAVKNMLR